jgi:predicted nucleic acid-binding protein
MKKLKLYLDTSVISYLEQEDAPEKMKETLLFWEQLKTGKYDAVISDIVTKEIENCGDEKKKTLTSYLAEITYELFALNEQSIRIAGQFIDLHILKEKCIDDCRHIAGAIVSGCDIIVSWNFKHIVNYKTQMGVKAITALEGYKELFVYTPTALIGGDDD